MPSTMRLSHSSFANLSYLGLTLSYNIPCPLNCLKIISLDSLVALCKIKTPQIRKIPFEIFRDDGYDRSGIWLPHGIV